MTDDPGTGEENDQGLLSDAVTTSPENTTGSTPPQSETDDTEPPDTKIDIDDPMFEVRTGIFENKQMVRVGWVPDGKRIVGRDDYIDNVSAALNDAVLGEQPEHLAITGKTGTGKSLVSRFVAARAQSAAVEGVSIGVVYVDCSESSTVTQLISTIGQKLNNNSPTSTDTTVRMPDAGLSQQKFYERLWQIMDQYDATICILDEVDMLADDVVLMNLAKAVEKQATTCNIGIIGISNVIGYFNSLDPRTASVFQPQELLFDPYNARDLRKILKARTDAFKPGVLTDGVIELVAALSAQEHGDARKAMRLFRMSGELAKKRGDANVTEEHVREAQEKVEKDRFQEFIEGTPQQMKVACMALAAEMDWGNQEYVMTGDLYETYEHIAETEDINTVSIRRFRDILSEMSMHKITELQTKNLGNRGGNNNVHRLLHDPEVVFKITHQDVSKDTIDQRTLRKVVQKHSR